jgi:dCMP deaminase
MNKHEYICAVCEVVAFKSNCFKRKVGAIFVNEDHEILATGYNAPPKGFQHCDILYKNQVVDIINTCGSPCMRNIHAEMNAIAQAAKRGQALKESVLYCTYTPCIDCARLLVNIGVQSVYVKDGNMDGGYEVLYQANIPLFSWEKDEKFN